MKNPIQWLMDNWKRERVALYVLALLLVVAEIGQFVLMFIDLKGA